MKRFYIHTFGCKTNQIETNLITEQLLASGYEVVSHVKDADIFIVNSCTVTSKTDDDVLRLIRTTKRKYPSLRVILTGCFAQLQSDVLSRNKDIDLVLGNSEKLNFTKYLDLNNKVNVADIFTQKEFIYKKIDNPTKTRASLKIQDGCNNRCTYCAIWKARGNSRSAIPQDIVEQLNKYIEHGFKEVVVTGIHIGQWGGDLTPKLGFTDFIDILENSGISRYRLGSLNPHELTSELIDKLASSDKFCPHFHLSLQSCCNKTLKNMNRSYTEDEILSLIDNINSKFNLPFIGSDIIVGFPDETDEDFNITLENIKKSGLTMAHVFPYSIRENTVAARMKNQISHNIKLERKHLLQEVVNQKYLEFLNNNNGMIHSVLFEKHKAKNGLYKGLTPNYITVYSDFNENICNKIKNCKLSINPDMTVFCNLL